MPMVQWIVGARGGRGIGVASGMVMTRVRMRVLFRFGVEKSVKQGAFSPRRGDRSMVDGDMDCEEQQGNDGVPGDSFH